MIQPALERLTNHARQWNVTIGSTQRTETSVIAFGMSGTRPVVLKVAKRAGEEWRSGELLAAFQGKGLVRPLEFADSAVLLERALPGHSLVDVSTTGHDEEATEIIATIIEQMSSVRPVWSDALSVNALASEFQLYGRSCEGLMPSGMVEKAEAEASEDIRAASRREPERALQWAFSSAVLAALWPTREDGIDMRLPFVTAATTMMGLLNE